MLIKAKKVNNSYIQGIDGAFLNANFKVSNKAAYALAPDTSECIWVGNLRRWHYH
jgi:hypothetical protein